MPNDTELAASDGYGIRDATPPGSMAWYCCLFAPSSDRPRLRALYAFRAELDRIAHQTAETDIARIKLAWWREEIDRYSRGEALHPICRALSKLEEKPTDSAALLAMIDAAEAELLQTRFPELADLQLHYRRGGSFFSLLAQEQSSTSSDDIHDRLMAIGTAAISIEKIRDLRRDLALGQVFIPLEWLDRKGLTINDLNTESPATAALTVVQELGNEVSSMLPAEFPDMPASAAVPATLYQRLHRANSKNGYRRVFDKRIELSGFQMLWNAWRAATHASKSTGKRGMT